MTLDEFIVQCAQDCVGGEVSWERLVGARHCPECNSEGCDSCQMTGWADGREP